VECYCIPVSLPFPLFLLPSPFLSSHCSPHNFHRHLDPLPSAYSLLGVASFGSPCNPANVLGANSYSQIDYTLRCMFPKYSDWNIQYTPRGLFKLRMKQTFQLLVLLIPIIGAYSIGEDFPGGLSALLETIRKNVKLGLLTLVGGLQRGANWLGA